MLSKDSFVTVFFQLLNQLESSGPPPADRDKISALPTVAITQEQVGK
jgi:E3 ubiquitin-protein ligase RNF115/126